MRRRAEVTSPEAEVERERDRPIPSSRASFLGHSGKIGGG
jgi:hypothetical protein